MAKAKMPGCLWPQAWGLSCHVYPHWQTRAEARRWCWEGQNQKAPTRCTACKDRAPILFIPQLSRVARCGCCNSLYRVKGPYADVLQVLGLYLCADCDSKPHPGAVEETELGSDG